MKSSSASSKSGGNPFVKEVRHTTGSQFASPSVIQDLSQQLADATMQTPPKSHRQQQMEMMKSSTNPQSQNVSKSRGQL
jgi:hypothetical protein